MVIKAEEKTVDFNIHKGNQEKWTKQSKHTDDKK